MGKYWKKGLLVRGDLLVVRGGHPTMRGAIPPHKGFVLK